MYSNSILFEEPYGAGRGCKRKLGILFSVKNVHCAYVHVCLYVCEIKTFVIIAIIKGVISTAEKEIEVGINYTTSKGLQRIL